MIRKGRWLYFLSSRVYNPIWDTVQAGVSFARSTKPYLLSLKADQLSPFIEQPAAPGEKEKEEDEEKKRKTEAILKERKKTKF